MKVTFNYQVLVRMLAVFRVISLNFFKSCYGALISEMSLVNLDNRNQYTIAELYRVNGSK